MVPGRRLDSLTHKCENYSAQQSEILDISHCCKENGKTKHYRICLCMYVCVYVCTYACMHVYAHIHAKQATVLLTNKDGKFSLTGSERTYLSALHR
jgi:hypothetical protein